MMIVFACVRLTRARSLCLMRCRSEVIGCLLQVMFAALAAGVVVSDVRSRSGLTVAVVLGVECSTVYRRPLGRRRRREV